MGPKAKTEIKYYIDKDVVNCLREKENMQLKKWLKLKPYPNPSQIPIVNYHVLVSTVDGKIIQGDHYPVALELVASIEGDNDEVFIHIYESPHITKTSYDMKKIAYIAYIARNIKIFIIALKLESVESNKSEIDVLCDITTYATSSKDQYNLVKFYFDPYNEGNKISQDWIIKSIRPAILLDIFAFLTARKFKFQEDTSSACMYDLALRLAKTLNTPEEALRWITHSKGHLGLTSDKMSFIAAETLMSTHSMENTLDRDLLAGMLEADTKSITYTKKPTFKDLWPLMQKEPFAMFSEEQTKALLKQHDATKKDTFGLNGRVCFACGGREEMSE